MQHARIITIAGKPGSGKSTTAQLVAERLGYERFSSGDLMRALATERSLSLQELLIAAQSDPSIDEAVDARIRDVGTNADRLVIDSRLAFHWIPSSFKVYLDLDVDVAAQRISAHQAEMRALRGETVTSQTAFARTLRERLQNDTERYQRLYGVDPHDPGSFDIIADTSKSSPEEIARQIIEAYQVWLGDQRA